MRFKQIKYKVKGMCEDTYIAGSHELKHYFCFNLIIQRNVEIVWWELPYSAFLSAVSLLLVREC